MKRHCHFFFHYIKFIVFICYSCESFVLTPPFAIKTINLFIKSNAKKVEYLIKHIRQNVLQIPKRISINRENKTEVKSESILTSIDIPKQNNYMNPRLVHKFLVKNSTEKVKVDKTDKIIKTAYKASVQVERKSTKQSTKNFIEKNILGAPKTKKIEYDTDDDFISISSSRRASGASTKSRKSWEESKIQVIKYNVSPPENIKTTASNETENAHIDKSISAQTR